MSRHLNSQKKNNNYLKHKESARTVIIKSLLHWSVLCRVDVKRVSIRDQKSRWGSCSGKGNLNFNYRLLFLPACLRDYVVIHELCHLKELNHGPKFWQLVEEQIPDYLAKIVELRKLEATTRMLPTYITRYSNDHTCEYCYNNQNKFSSN